MRAVIDPPAIGGRYLFQEECCFNVSGRWSVPARALHIATDLGAPYIPPLDSWEAFAKAVLCYERVWMLYTFPLAAFLDVPKHVRHRITAVTNPHRCRSTLDGAGFAHVTTTAAFELDVSEDLWFLFDGQPATVQVASGCPFLCDYCVWSRNAFPRRQWAPPATAAELSRRAESPYLLCPQITGNRAWLDEFLRLRGPKAGDFYTDLNASHLPTYAPDIRRLAAAGMNKAVVGLEALSDASIRRLRCPHTVGQARQMFALLAELGVRGVYQLRRGFGETLREISETTRELLSIAETFKPDETPHEIRTGPFTYWHEGDLSASLTLHTVEPLGYPAHREKLDRERTEAWSEAYSELRAAGWRVR